MHTWKYFCKLNLLSESYIPYLATGFVAAGEVGKLPLICNAVFCCFGDAHQDVASPPSLSFC